jgi:putative Holliday junction resolvase
MGRILSIDYGRKRTGLAVTDPLQIIVTGLTALDTKDLFPFLDQYQKDEEVVKIVIGYPFFDHVYNEHFKKEIDQFIDKVKKRYHLIPVDLHDESFTSHRAKSVILASGARKKQRRDKKLVDKMSAVIILQEYLGHI